MSNSLWHKIKHKVKVRVENISPYSSFKQPIFIISPPRSGSTFLFECLQQFTELYYLTHEADYIWWSIFPYEQMQSPSDHVGKEYLSYKKICNLRKKTYEDIVKNYLKRHPEQSKHLYLFGIKPVRYLDKTIAHCFHLDFLEQTFPKAKYIFLVRDPRATISSMIEGWPHIELFGKPQLTPIIRSLKKSTIEHWSYPAPPGWQNVIDQSLSQICAWSWKQHIEYALKFSENTLQEAKWIRYEDLIKNTDLVISNLADYLDLQVTSVVEQYLGNPPLSNTTVSKPNPNKWKEKHYEQVTSILPMIENTSRKIGYDVYSL